MPSSARSWLTRGRRRPRLMPPWLGDRAASSSAFRRAAAHVRSADTPVRLCRGGHPQADKSVRAPGEPAHGSLKPPWLGEQAAAKGLHFLPEGLTSKRASMGS